MKEVVSLLASEEGEAVEEYEGCVLTLGNEAAAVGGVPAATGVDEGGYCSRD